MGHLAVLSLLGVMATVLSAPAKRSSEGTMDLLMPGVSPQKPDTYLCHGVKINDKKKYITKFIPKANMNIAHHMLLYGCIEPGLNKNVWNCGEMASNGNGYDMAPTCSSGSKIMYAWAMDAPSLTLPKDVGFAIGSDTDVKYLVLQVHYKNVTTFQPPLNKKDSSGLTLKITKKKISRPAGVYLLGTGGDIPAHSVEYMETACKYPGGDLKIHPFAYRTHTHKLGRVVSGYRIRDGKWTEIGRMNPQKPQMFYNATTPGLTVKNGDILAARCTMKNDGDHMIQVGATQKDEMCNFYIMYYVEGKRTLQNGYCFSPGPPTWYWKNFKGGNMNLAAMPSIVSTVPGSDVTLAKTTRAVKQSEDEDQELDTMLRSMNEEDLMSLMASLDGTDDDRRDLDEYYYSLYNY